MVDVLEYNELRWASRDEVQEEEECAMPLVQLSLKPPVVTWNPSMRPHLQDNVLKCSVLIFATSPAACALVNHCFPSKEAAGTVHRAADPDASEAPGSAPQQGSVCQLHTVQGSSGLVLLAAVQAPGVPAEASVVWARTVLEAVEAAHVVVLATMAAEQLRGPADPSQESLLYRLHTAASRQQEAAAGPRPPVAPYLPSGSLISGLPAALISNRQIRQKQGECLVAVEASPLMASDSVASLAAVGARLLTALGEPEVAAQLSDKAQVAAARQAAGKSARHHPAASLFI